MIHNDIAINTDRYIVNEILLGNDVIFKELYTSYAPKIRKRAYNFGSYDVEDIIQNTFMKFFENLNSFKFQSSLTSYLYMIALNEIRTKSRSNKKLLKKDSLVLPMCNDIEQLFLDKEEFYLVKEKYDNMDSKYQLPLKLSLQGKCLLDISKELNITVANVKSRVYRARSYLRLK
jgi:RNA polymerase sigma-70 factor, ECF subfamily